MNLNIGENIKHLRQSRGITQETLAEHMNVSCPAVSKWERGETLPDITMILPLASYFGVSTDELLGLDSVKNEEKIKEYLKENDRLLAIGKESEAVDLITSAYNEFPNDRRIMGSYMCNLFYDPKYITKPYGYEVHKSELYRLCDRALSQAIFDDTHYSAMSMLKELYLNDGLTEKAIEIANQFPGDYIRIRQEELEDCYDINSEEWNILVGENIDYLLSHLHSKMCNRILWSDKIDATEKIRLLNKTIGLIDSVIDGDYCCYYGHLSMTYYHMAGYYAIINETESAIHYIGKCLEYAKMYDDLPEKAEYSSFFLKGCVFDKMKMVKGTEGNNVKDMINNIRSNEKYQILFETAELKALIEKYEQFAE